MFIIRAQVVAELVDHHHDLEVVVDRLAAVADGASNRIESIKSDRTYKIRSKV